MTMPEQNSRPFSSPGNGRVSTEFLPAAGMMHAEEPLPDNLKLYLKEARRRPLLKHSQEIKLAQKLETGMLATYRLLTTNNLVGGETTNLLSAAYSGNEARTNLIESNLRLVVFVANKHTGKGMALEDLIQEGNVGLFRAVEKYDWRRGFRFSTYAHGWISQAVTRALAGSSREIRQPVHYSGWLSHLFKETGDLAQELQREPTKAEIAARMGVPIKKINEALRVIGTPVSLDQQVGSDENTIADIIPDKDPGVDPQLQAEKFIYEEGLMEALSGILTPREIQVAELRHGFRDGRPRTMQDIGNELGITRERVRQLLNQIRVKARSPGGKQALQRYID